MESLVHIFEQCFKFRFGIWRPKLVSDSTMPETVGIPLSTANRQLTDRSTDRIARRGWGVSKGIEPRWMKSLCLVLNRTEHTATVWLSNKHMGLSLSLWDCIVSPPVWRDIHYSTLPGCLADESQCKRWETGWETEREREREREREADRGMPI